jgi:hypothetical protein
MSEQFLVRQTFATPAWDERDGIVYTVAATTKAEAIRKARKLADQYGHCGTGSRSWFKVIDGEG